MEGAKPGVKQQQVRPGGPAGVPQVGQSPHPAPAAQPARPSSPGAVSRSQNSAMSLRPAPLAKAGFGAQVGASTVFGARIQQFNIKNNPQPPAAAPGEGAFKSMSGLKHRNEQLQELALSEKGLSPEKVSEVLDFMEAVGRSGRFFEDDMQRAAMNQILTFWSRQVKPLVDKQIDVALHPFAGAF